MAWSWWPASELAGRGRFCCRRDRAWLLRPEMLPIWPPSLERLVREPELRVRLAMEGQQGLMQNLTMERDGRPHIERFFAGGLSENAAQVEQVLSRTLA